MKLLRILGVFLAISLFAGCEVWISFWGDAATDRVIEIDATDPYSSPNELRAAVYREFGSSYTLMDSVGAGGSNVLSYTFTGLDSGVYRVVVWNDLSGDGRPQTGENGFSTDPIDLFFFSQWTVEASTLSDWSQDGSSTVKWFPGL